MKNTALLIGFFSIASFSFSQEITEALPVQVYASEVYRDCPDYAGPEYLANYAERLQRVEIRQEPVTSGETYPKLSSVSLKNKCNPELVRDELNFNAGAFNALKYRFNFQSQVQQIYRVDNTAYIIVLHPKK